MAADSFRYLLEQISRLSHADQQKLAAELAHFISQPPRPRRSILELRGLGKEVWSKVDAQDYVRKERATWSD